MCIHNILFVMKTLILLILLLYIRAILWSESIQILYVVLCISSLNIPHPPSSLSRSYLVKWKYTNVVYRPLYIVLEHSSSSFFILELYREVEVFQLCTLYKVCSSLYSLHFSSFFILELSCEVEVSRLCTLYIMCSSLYSLHFSFFFILELSCEE